MLKATLKDKQLVISVLSEAFENNHSVNYVVKQDAEKAKRIKALMDYSFNVCYQYGNVFLSNDKQACALILYPDKQKSTILLDLNLVFNCIGLTRAKKVLQRNSKIKNQYPEKEIAYLWFIGVNKQQQGKGLGTLLLKEIIEYTELLKRPIYLETSMPQNLPFYKNLGFEIYSELNFGHQLYLMRKPIS